MYLYICLCVFSIHIAFIEDFYIYLPRQPYFLLQSIPALSLHMFDIISIQTHDNMLRACAIISNYSRFAVLSRKSLLWWILNFLATLSVFSRKIYTHLLYFICFIIYVK